MGISEDLELASPDSAGGRRLDLRAIRLGLVNAVLCGLLVVAIVASAAIGSFVRGDGVGMLFAIMVFYFIPLAFIPIGLSCLVGAIRSGVELRRHPSREARTGLWLSLGGPIAVVACYVILFGVALLSS